MGYAREEIRQRLAAMAEQSSLTESFLNCQLSVFLVRKCQSPPAANTFACPKVLDEKAHRGTFATAACGLRGSAAGGGESDRSSWADTCVCTNEVRCKCLVSTRGMKGAKGSRPQAHASEQPHEVRLLASRSGSGRQTASKAQLAPGTATGESI